MADGAQHPVLVPELPQTSPRPPPERPLTGHFAPAELLRAREPQGRLKGGRACSRVVNQTWFTYVQPAERWGMTAEESARIREEGQVRDSIRKGLAAKDVKG